MIYAFQALESMAFHSKISCLQNRVVSHSGKLLHRVCILWNMPNREKVFASSGVAARVTTFRHEKQLRTEPQSAGCWSNASCPSKHRTAKRSGSELSEPIARECRRTENPFSLARDPLLSLVSAHNKAAYARSPPVSRLLCFQHCSPKGRNT